MNSQPRKAIENGLTAQLMNSVTPMPRQCSFTRDSAAKSIFAQHRDDHQPDQHRHRQVDLGDLGGADDVEHGRKDVPERDPDNNAQRDPEGEITFESRHGWLAC